ncbi:hypothetical protein [Streptantibioticus ferralitis]|uniref:Uncharacterized protein n=1 Tax=Streptantibioticus ferralitis TaxID=236510 RepID=A0ABT5YUC7_9ACTN|nr:hypothetical protein [Streptantibioticus ferralitis]MDF2255218.1 hypothetical protein [Streptantibioticus ferralitis]
MNPTRHPRRAGRPRRPGAARILRIRYAAVGVVLALTWMGEGNEPAWGHALRAVLILLIVPPALLLSDRRLTRAVYESAHPRWPIARLITVRTAIISAAFGAAYLLGCLVDPHAAHSVVFLGVRLLLVLLTIPLQIRAAHRMRASEVHPSTDPVVSAPRLIGAKLALIAAALLAQTLLGHYTPNASAMVAAAIALTAAIVGPRIHDWLLITPTTPKNAPSRAAA